MSVIWFLVGIPVAVEVIAALLGFRDCIRISGLRVHAIELLIVPSLMLGALLWIASPVYWFVIPISFATVIAWQVALHIGVQVLVRRRSFSASVIDTDRSPQ
jgi:sterol desaturase/sphingolipid hydroxylase (fatty acid hydroxylase superfamily)